MNDDYWAWHDQQSCPESPPAQVCQEPECRDRWSAYCDRDHEADALMDVRHDIYFQIVHRVQGALEEVGIVPPARTLEVIARWAQPLAILEAGGRTFTLVGSVSFMEPCHETGWGDCEVIIGD